MSDLRVVYLNHAAVLVELAGVRLLSDPWFGGTAFSGGWGLRYDNPEAMALARTATHLWISHWHSDHLHVPTLRALAAESPGIVVLANESQNFTMVENMRSLGFERVIALRERQPLELPGGISVIRYPTAGIDNMLHIHGGGLSILNYNDCNLPRAAITSLQRRIGRVDLLLINYNHAGKLFEVEDARTIMDGRWDVVRQTVDAIAPAWVIPFASDHFYRVPASQWQNASLLTIDDVARRCQGDARFVVLRIGDSVAFDGMGAGRVTVTRRRPVLEPRSIDTIDYGPSATWDEVIEAAARRLAELRAAFPFGLSSWIPPVHLLIEDLDRTLALDLRTGPRETRSRPHVSAHSRAVMTWLGHRFGDDTFLAGAHFGMVGAPREVIATPIQRWMLASLLMASKLDPRSMLGHLRTRAGRRFLLNRSSEVWATVSRRRLRAGQMRI